jgi:hypothetical protein
MPAEIAPQPRISWSVVVALLRTRRRCWRQYHTAALVVLRARTRGPRGVNKAQTTSLVLTMRAGKATAIWFATRSTDDCNCCARAPDENATSELTTWGERWRYYRAFVSEVTGCRQNRNKGWAVE